LSDWAIGPLSDLESLNLPIAKSLNSRSKHFEPDQPVLAFDLNPDYSGSQD